MVFLGDGAAQSDAGTVPSRDEAAGTGDNRRRERFRAPGAGRSAEGERDHAGDRQAGENMMLTVPAASR
jgi:hypothetical protein